jgi:hypothetical protein
MTNSIILLIAELAGVVLLVGTMLLLGLRRIYIDSETKEPIEFEIPFIGKMKMQAPALFLVAAGVMLIGYAVHEDPQAAIVQQGTLAGSVDLQGANATILLLALPTPYVVSRETTGPYSIPVPLLPGVTDYQVQYEVDGHVFPKAATFANGRVTVEPFTYMPPAPVNVQPVKDISDAELQKLKIN